MANRLLKAGHAVFTQAYTVLQKDRQKRTKQQHTSELCDKGTHKVSHANVTCDLAEVQKGVLGLPWGS